MILAPISATLPPAKFVVILDHVYTLMQDPGLGDPARLYIQIRLSDGPDTSQDLMFGQPISEGL
jgi:hypothetical protein